MELLAEGYHLMLSKMEPGPQQKKERRIILGQLLQLTMLPYRKRMLPLMFQAANQFQLLHDKGLRIFRFLHHCDITTCY